MKTMIVAILLGCIATSIYAAEWSFFTALDKDGDGKVTQKEFVKWKKKQAQKKDLVFDLEATQKIFADMDANGDGFITQEEMDANQAKNKEKKNK